VDTGFACNTVKASFYFSFNVMQFVAEQILMFFSLSRS